MAKAKLIPPVPVTPNVQLELTPEEAQTLLDITRNIGGNPTETRRKHSDSIASALRSVGYTSNSRPYDIESNSSFYFLTKDGKKF